jgi:fibronectin-binding autotransporter adhesin
MINKPRRFTKQKGWLSFLAISFGLLHCSFLEAQLFITTDQTQNGGTLTVSPAHAAIVSSAFNPTLTLTNGATANGMEAVVIGSLSGHSGSLVIDQGSTLTNSGNHGSLGTFGSETIYSGNAYIGLNSGSVGMATVSGSGSGWSIDNELIVGFAGSGTLSIEDGGFVSNASGYLGYSGGNGAATISGMGSTWINYGMLRVSNNGTLNIFDGGHVQNNFGFLYSNSIATISGNGSVWDNGVQFHVNNSSLNIDSGGYVQNYDGFLENNSIASVTGSGSFWNNNQELRVDSSTLNIEDGGTVSSGNGFIGGIGNGGPLATVTVSGVGSSWMNSNILSVGQNYYCEMHVLNGGSVSSGEGYIGENGQGVVTVSGNGSTWTNSGDLFIGGSSNSHIGYGSLNVLAGGHVHNGTGHIAENYQTGNSHGDVTVSGAGSTWTNSGALFIGGNGSGGEGSLEISAGGHVQNETGYIGMGLSSLGFVNVSGDGSTWTNSGELFIGGNNYGGGGSGTLYVFEGGQVHNKTGYIGSNLESHGSVIVRDSGSTWNNSGDLILGGIDLSTSTDGYGELTIADGGMVSVGGTTRIHGNPNNPSTIHLQSGGKLITHDFDASGGGVFNFSGGTLELTGGTFTGDLAVVAGAIFSGAGSVNGDLNLSGVLQPGNSPGILYIQGDLTWYGGGLINFELGGLASDLIGVGGTFSRGSFGTLNFHFSDAGDFVPGTYTLVTFGDTDFSLNDFSYSSDISGFSGAFSINGNSLQFSEIPEPHSLLMISVACGLLAARPRRRKKRTG